MKNTHQDNVKYFLKGILASKEVTSKILCYPCLRFSFFPDCNFPLFKLTLTSFLLFLHFPNGCCRGNDYIRAERSMYGCWRTERIKVCGELEQKLRTFFVSGWVELTDLGFFFIFVFTQVIINDLSIIFSFTWNNYFTISENNFSV